MIETISLSAGERMTLMPSTSNDSGSDVPPSLPFCARRRPGAISRATMQADSDCLMSEALDLNPVRLGFVISAHA